MKCGEVNQGVKAKKGHARAEVREASGRLESSEFRASLAAPERAAGLKVSKTRAYRSTRADCSAASTIATQASEWQEPLRAF